MDVFTRLRDWQHGGLLDEMTLTIERLHRPGAEDGEQDDGETDDAGANVLVTYDQLSDGEQMLLGRMGLIFLLRGQDGSLLLMDEPETHFNDVWKREIVEMLDMGLLNSTEVNVIVATHTSIALTDAFAAEVPVLDKHRGAITALALSGGLFGTDPGEVNMNLFRADSSTGRRSEALLDRLLKADWQGKEAELEAILGVLGSSFHRAELRAILKRLRAGGDGPTFAWAARSGGTAVPSSGATKTPAEGAGRSGADYERGGYRLGAAGVERSGHRMGKTVLSGWTGGAHSGHRRGNAGCAPGAQ